MTDAGRREVTPDEARAILTAGELDLLGRMPWSSNRTYLAHVLGDVPVMTVYKPAEGERPLWDFGRGSLCRREVAAALVSETLGWAIVPPTVLRDGPLGIGMLQLFIEHDPEEHYFVLRDDATLDARFRQFAAFDVIINNADRKSGHCLRAANGHVWGIDHGLAFHADPKLRTVIWEYVGDRLEPKLADDLCRLDQSLAAGDVHDEMAALLDPGELDALRARTQRLVRTGVYPEPTTDYPYPWPMV